MKGEDPFATLYIGINDFGEITGIPFQGILELEYLNEIKDSLKLFLGAKNLKEIFVQEKNSKLSIANFLKNYLPKKFVDNWCEANIEVKRLVDYKLKELELIANKLHHFTANIDGNEGYIKAEVTAGGVDTKELSSKTMAAQKVANLYFIGEVVDVTGWLGGYNFQWAWSSGYSAGLYA